MSRKLSGLRLSGSLARAMARSKSDSITAEGLDRFDTVEDVTAKRVTSSLVIVRGFLNRFSTKLMLCWKNRTRGAWGL